MWLDIYKAYTDAWFKDTQEKSDSAFSYAKTFFLPTAVKTLEWDFIWNLHYHIMAYLFHPIFGLFLCPRVIHFKLIDIIK